VENKAERVQDSSSIVSRRELMLPNAYVAPRTPTEVKLAEIWRKTLTMDRVGISDDFEELGGDSLLAASMVAEIETVFAIAVPIGSLARAPTIEQLASRIDSLIAKK
jgi:acyl carrier protein